jgi:hypothetical protein
MGVTAQNDAIVIALLVVHLLALAVGCAFWGAIVLLKRRARATGPHIRRRASTIPSQTIFPQRPTCWLAIRAGNPERVQAALGLARSAPCSWSEGMTGEHEFFVSPRVNGWVIVTGVGIPAPDDDVDECFRFLISLSRKLGHVQFFHAEKYQHYHAWARLDYGCVTRAYAWAGETVWNQGLKTIPEIELGLRCIDYGETCPPHVARANAEKVSRLAARWNFDPATVDERLLNQAFGVAGELPEIY